MTGRRRWLPLVLVALGCEDEAPVDAGADGGACGAAVEAVVDAAPRDAWSAMVVFRETTLAPHGRPAGGWYVTPLHGHLLMDGRVLLHGEMKDHNRIEASAERHVVNNDVQWVVDPSAPPPAQDRDDVIRPILPWRQWIGDPLGTQTDPEGGHGQGRPTELLMCGGTTWLADGRLLYAGGSGSYTTEPSQPHPPAVEGVYEGGTWKSAYLDPWGDVAGGGAWRVGPSLRQGMRYYGTALRLADGDVLAVSGLYDTDYYDHPGIERLDVRANEWRELVPSLPAQREVPRDDPRAGLAPQKDDYPHAFVLPTSVPASAEAAAGIAREVAVLGRRGDVTLVSVGGGEGLTRLVRPASWRRPDDAAAPTEERMHGASSVLLPDGRIAVVGGSDSATIAGRYDVLDPRPSSPTFGEWRSTPLCAGADRCHARVHGMALLTAGGDVLMVAGRPPGAGSPGDPRVPLIIDGATGAVREGTPWPDDDVRGYHAVVVTALDGRVLVAGGRNYRWSRCARYGAEYCEDERPDMRWYSPPWLDPALARYRPTITGAPRETSGAAAPQDHAVPVLGYAHDYVVPVGTERPAGCATPLSAVLMGMPTQTHSFDSNQRAVPLTVTWVGGAFTVRTPAGASAAPPGPYLLVVTRPVRVRADGSTVRVPSVARPVLLR